jgi:hypothetical protein
MKQNGSIHGVIAHLHEMKASYQRNMAMALALACFLVGFPTYLLCLLAEKQPAAVVSAVDHPGLSHDSLASETAAGLPYLLRSRFAHEGFGGFGGYTIMRRSAGPSIRVMAVPKSSAWGGAHTDIASEDPVSFYSSINPVLLDEDFGLPRARTFFDIVPSTRWTVDVPGSGMQGRSFASDRSPPLILLTDIRYPRKGWYLKGIVKVSFVIVENGGIEDYRLVLEEPAGHEFAIALKEAINKSEFFPGTVDGEKVPVQVILTYEFCWNCTEPVGVQYSEGVVVKRKPY